ncbi:MAG: hypothetical protein MJ118_07805, partial [Clostridia bacterium]|nr:hypothetical protein [Clostridia bacterium]
MDNPYFKLCIAAFLPVLAAGAAYIAEKKTAFGKLDVKIRQLFFGLIFGVLAIVGTEWGIPINGAQMNCRDAAVLIAGLLFGAPAGLIAGVLGGAERWLAVYWGVGSFTRVACTVSTVFAGVFAAGLRKYMFEDKKPSWMISLAIGVVVEVFHMSTVFITNMETPTEAMAVVRACTIPMITANGFSVMLASMLISFLASEDCVLRTKTTARISQTIQRWLFIAVFLAFLATSYFVFKLQNEIAIRQTDSFLNMAIDEVAADIQDASDENLLSLTERIAGEVYMDTLDSIAEKYDVAEISLVNYDGLIYRSTQEKFIGYDMSSGEQSSEFLCLLDDVLRYVQRYGPISFDKSISRKYAGVRTAFGFVQVGYDAEHFQKDIDKQVIGITRNRHVGQTGYILVMDENLKIVSAPKGFEPQSVTQDTSYMQEGVVYEVDAFGTPCFCENRITEGYYLVAVLPKDEALQMRNIALYVNTFMEILVFAILFGMIYFLIKRVVVNQITSINGSLAKITGGNLNETVNVRTSEEFASLSDDINSTVDTLKRYIDEASARIDQELEFAKNIQSSALPSVFPA